jgi:hypothetical protein
MDRNCPPRIAGPDTDRPPPPSDGGADPVRGTLTTIARTARSTTQHH